MSRGAAVRGLFKDQQKTVRGRLEQCNEAAKALSLTLTTVFESEGLTIRDTVASLGLALVQANVLVAKTIAMTQAERDMVAISAAAGYLDDTGPNRSSTTKVNADLLEEAYEALTYLRTAGHVAEASVVDRLITAAGLRGDQ